MNFLIVVDMQNDFISGSLGSAHAAAIVPNVVKKVSSFDGTVIYTRDTHGADYMHTQEGEKLPVVHCIKDTPGWEICDELKPYVQTVVDKPTFGCVDIPRILSSYGEDVSRIELCGLCTDICVISNAMIVKAAFPEAQVTVDSSCCAGVTMESHQTALDAMKAVQIEILRDTEVIEMDQIYLQTKAVVEELGEKAGLKVGQILVVGCSTSEVLGAKIGSNSSPEVAKYIFKALQEYSANTGVHIAIQCCEHLNRAIIVERKAVPNAEIVNVVPQPKAGGSLATQAYASFEDPVALEEIKADAGMDIGFTLIGMHLKKVAVPVRLENKHIGNALIVAARTRPKFIGGSRAIYADDMK